MSMTEGIQSKGGWKF